MASGCSRGRGSRRRRRADFKSMPWVYKACTVEVESTSGEPLLPMSECPGGPLEIRGAREPAIPTHC